MTGNNKKSFIMLKEWGEQLQFLDNDQTADLFRMIFIYQSSPEDGVPVSEYPIVNSIFLTMRNFFDASDERYEDMCETNRQNGQKGGRPRKTENRPVFSETEKNRPVSPETENNQTVFSKTLSESESEYEYEYGTEEERAPKGAPKKNAARSVPFKPPAAEEVEAYIAEKGYNVDAEAFIAFYQSNGWKVGKNSMKDWKAAVRTWNHREKGREPPKADNKRNSFNDFPQREYSEEEWENMENELFGLKEEK